jgi:hypothetical protein
MSTDATTNTVPIGPDGKIVFKDSPRKRGGCLKAILIAGVVAVALIALLVFVVFKTTAGAEKQARGFATEMIANDVNAAYERTSTDFRESTSKASLAEIAGRLNSLLAGAKLSNTGRSISSSTGNKAVAAMDYTATKGEQKLYLRVNVRRDSKGWKVVNFESSEKPIADADDTSVETSVAA